MFQILNSLTFVITSNALSGLDIIMHHPQITKSMAVAWWAECKAEILYQCTIKPALLTPRSLPSSLAPAPSLHGLPLSVPE